MPAPSYENGDWDDDEEFDLQEAFADWEQSDEARMLVLQDAALDGDEAAIEEMADLLDDFFS